MITLRDFISKDTDSHYCLEIGLNDKEEVVSALYINDNKSHLFSGCKQNVKTWVKREELITYSCVLLEINRIRKELKSKIQYLLKDLTINQYINPKYSIPFRNGFISELGYYVVFYKNSDRVKAYYETLSIDELMLILHYLENNL